MQCTNNMRGQFAEARPCLRTWYFFVKGVFWNIIQKDFFKAINSARESKSRLAVLHCTCSSHSSQENLLNDINISHESKTKFPVQHCTCSAQGPYRIYKNLLYRTFFTKTLPDLEGHAKRKKENIREEKKRKSDLF